MNEKLTELLKDEAVVEEFLKQETTEAAQKFLASKGVEISDEEIEQLGKAIAAAANKSEEMNDDELEKVAGGFSVSSIIKPSIIKPKLPDWIKPFLLIGGK
jgi:hypothetical protein